MVSAWAEANELVLGQRKVDDKSNEITAIPELLKILSLEGCIVTIDAIGTQTKIAKAIIDAGADYLLSVKDNQKKLHQEIAWLFEYDQRKNFSTVHSLAERENKVQSRHFFSRNV
jgi:predicted transposase YbfD/YdcC